jgi:hypothetical protein
MIKGHYQYITNKCRKIADINAGLYRVITVKIIHREEKP